MKKFVMIFILSVIILFILIMMILGNDNYNDDKMISLIEKKCRIDNISYINRYNDYYIVRDKESLYLINDKYKIISEIDNDLLYENRGNYDIIYDDGIFMYFDDKLLDGRLIYSYYDIYSYELIKEIKVGEDDG